MNLQVQLNMNDQTTTPIQTESSHGAVAQLDDTGRGMSGKGACGKTTTNFLVFFYHKKILKSLYVWFKVQNTFGPKANFQAHEIIWKTLLINCGFNNENIVEKKCALF